MNVKKINLKLASVIIALSFMGGGLLYAFLSHTIILNMPSLRSGTPQSSKLNQVYKKEVTLSLFKNGTMKKEHQKIVWSSSLVDNCTLLINSWLTLLVDEGITRRRISLQSVATDSAEKHLFVSFEQTLFDPDDTTYKKLMLIESLLKTIKDNVAGVQNIFFLVQHQPLEDQHLSFTLAWPL